jgi:DNA-directed RNA polymerase subunit alpha
MFPINKFNIKVVSESDNEGVFQIGPLPKGFGNSIATTFRRILLSSIPGAAITSVKLEGVQHEYTTLSGLQDDVLSVVLAFKNVAVISHSEEPVTLKLNVKGDKSGPKVVTAADIEANPLVEIVNPDLVITTLADAKAEINAELRVERGIGYSLPDESVRAEIGTIPLDAIFTPVKLVTPNVTQARVGQQTDLDALELQIVTNGTVTPSAVLNEAAEIMLKVSEHFLQEAKALLNDKSSRQVSEAILPVEAESAAVATSAAAPLRVEELNLSTRLTNALLNADYLDLRQLDGLTEEEVAGIKGMGEKSFVELKETMAKHGLKLI